jgi:hypothetical protein
VEISNFPSRADLRRFSDGKRLTLTSIAVDPDFLSAPVILGQQVWWIWARRAAFGIWPLARGKT